MSLPFVGPDQIAGRTGWRDRREITLFKTGGDVLVNLMTEPAILSLRETGA